MVVSATLVIAACRPADSSNSTSSPSATESAAVAAEPVKVVPRPDVTSNNYLPPLDDKRVRIAVPAGWSMSPRNDAQYLVQFQKDRASLLPRIRITVEENPWPELEPLTEESVEPFERRVSESVQGPAVVEPPRAMLIGGVPCVRYVKAATIKSNESQRQLACERQVLVTLAQGRMYTVDLQVHRGKIPADRDTAYEILAGMQFIEEAP